MGNPQSSTFGLRVSKTTMRRGTKKIRNTVSELGRFIAPRGGKASPVPATTTVPHYRLRLWRRQRPLGESKIMKEQSVRVDGNRWNRAGWTTPFPDRRAARLCKCGN